MRKKILIIDPAEIMGGAELFMQDLIVNLDKTKFDIHVISGNKNYPKNKINTHILSLPKLKPISPVTLVRFIKTRKKIEKIIKETKPDIILSNTVRSHILVSSLAKKNNIPMIWFAHDDTFPSWLLKRLIHIPTSILTCSEYIKKWIQKNTDERWNEKIKVVWNGVNMEEIKNTGKQKKEKIIIGIVGRLVPWKGQKQFLLMANMLSKKRKDIEYQIIGNAYRDKKSEKYAKELERLIKKFGLETTVTIKKNIKDIYQTIGNLDILIHNSLNPEPFGRVIIEAMALKTPVIASNLGGTAEIVDDGVDGFLVDPNDTNAVTERVEKLLENEKLYKLFQENAYDKVTEKFNLKKITKNIESVILHDIKNGREAQKEKTQ